MLEHRLKVTAAGRALCGLVLPLLLTQCGTNNDENGGVPGAGASGAGASGADAQSGAAGALAGTVEVGGGGARSNDGGAAGSTESAGLGGDFAAGSTAGPAGRGAESAGSSGSVECGSESTDFTSPSAAHVATCSAINYPMNPPVYGDHYPVWAAYKSYPFPVPLGFLVHNLEHGAIVLLYNCPEGCSDEVASAQAWIDALPADPRCADDVKHQVVMSPDRSLPKRWAAVAWGHSLTADCFAPLAVRAFYDANVAHGGEDICSNGADLSADVCQ